jgi:hypothetical protein
LSGPEAKPEEADDHAESKKEETAKPREIDLEKLLGVNLSRLTETGRIQHIALVRDAVDALARLEAPGAEALANRIKLLRIWTKLVNMRVEHVRRDGPPPEHHPAARRRKERAHVVLKSKQETDALAQEQVKAEIADAGPTLVKLRLIEAGVVKGVRLPAGILIEVEPHDAEDLLESKKAERVETPGH